MRTTFLFASLALYACGARVTDDPAESSDSAQYPTRQGIEGKGGNLGTSGTPQSTGGTGGNGNAAGAGAVVGTVDKSDALGTGQNARNGGPLDGPAASRNTEAGTRLSGPEFVSGRAHITDFVFDDKKLSTWNLTIAPADIRKMDKTLLVAGPDGNREVPVPAMLKVDDEDVGMVTVRYKGNYGSLYSCVITGTNICKKLSLKVDFDEFDATKRFHGLKKVNLHGQFRDRTHMHENLGYKLFREMGIPAPRTAYGKVYVNGEYRGLYTVTENVDSRFLDYWFPKGQAEGNLYKDVWPRTTDRNLYVAQQKTNEPDPKDPKKTVVPPTKIIKAAMAIGAAKDADLPKVVAQWMNVDHMLRYLAVDRALGHFDGPQTFRAGGPTGMGVNKNFYIYESPTEDRLYLLPWDLDHTWEVFSWFEVVHPWDMVNPNCNENTLASGNQLTRPACDRIYKGLRTAAGDKLKSAVKLMVDTAFNVEKMRAQIDTWADLIAPAVMMDTNGPGFLPWQAKVAGLKKDVGVIREKMVALANGIDPVHLAVMPGIPMGFEDVTPYQFAMGTYSSASAQSQNSSDLNTKDPIAGKTDVKMTFTLKNSTDDAMGAFDQGAAIRLNLARQYVDLSAMKQLKIKLRSDVARLIRIDFSSSKYKTKTGRIPRLGWEVMVTPQGVSVVLDVTKMEVPLGLMAAGDDVKTVLSAVSQINIIAQPANRNPTTGLMPTGATETGWAQFDDIELLTN